MDLGRWGDGEMDEWNKERKKKRKKECVSAQSKFERGVYLYEVADDA